MKTRLMITYILSLLALGSTLSLQHRFNNIEANPFGKILLKSKFLVIFYKVVIVGIALIIIYLEQSEFTNIISWALLLIFTALDIYHAVLIGRVHYILFLR